MATDISSALDLDAYLRRVGYSGDLAPTRAVLEGLHLAHATHIPFENLDIHLGRPIRLDLDSLQAKLVRDRRGGYCFEQNLLFAAVLEHVGFGVRRLAARVRLGATRLLARTHMVMEVSAEGESWLADAGFGAGGLLGPVPLAKGQSIERYGRTHRVCPGTGYLVLQARHGDGWQDLYAFTREPQQLVDYEMASYYVSTHPDSVFVRTLTAQRETLEAGYALRGYDLTIARDGVVTTHTIPDDDERLRVLAEIFGLEFPPGTRFGPAR
jgi:N-hydroxyarylamine O-acetyltransferase